MFELIQEVQRDLEVELPIVRQSQFKKGFKKHRNDKKVMGALKDMLDHIKFNRVPPAEYNAHQLTARMKGYWDAHLKGSQVLLLYQIFDDKLVLSGLGSHKELNI